MVCLGVEPGGGGSMEGADESTAAPISRNSYHLLV